MDMVLIEGGKVVQKEIVNEGEVARQEELEGRGFIEAPEGTVCGDLYDGEEFSPAPPAAKDWDEIRIHRNALLAECDYTQIPDSPLSPSEKAEWAAYRAELREITEGPDPNNVEWPEKPA